MHRDLTDCRAIVTGASSGIGRAVAAELAAAGARVVLAARSADRLEATAAELRGRGYQARAVPCDITSADDRARLAATAVGFWGGLDLLVNNAGVASWGHFASSTEAINRRVMETNFFAPVELTRLCVPHLENGCNPAVVNVTSMCGRRGMPAWPEYSASKFALVGMSEAWRAEFARFGIDVVTIVPGLTRTELSRNMLRNDGRADIRYDEGMDPAAVARAIVAAARVGTTEVVLGPEARRMLLVNRFFPRLLNRLIARRITKLYRRPEA